MRDYHDLYLKTDVLILADVFERFRELCLDPAYLGLDPAHYVSAPQLSWDGMLKHTRIVLDLVHDHEMYRLMDNGLRGGICMISQRYARANNPRMGADYNPVSPIPISSTSMPIIYMGGPCPRCSPRVGSNCFYTMN